MKNNHRLVKLIIVFFLAIGLFGCSEETELIQNEIKLYEGQNFDLKEYLSNLYRNDEKIEVIDNKDTTTSGNYDILYKLNGANAVLKVVVLNDPITLKNQEIVLVVGSPFNPKDYISEEDIGNDIKINSNVNTEKAGEYRVVYTFSGIEKVLKVIVKNVDIVLTQSSISIALGSTFDPRDYLSEDLLNSSKISVQNSVNTSEIGTYKVVYSMGNISKTLTVTVKDVSPILTKTSVSINQGSEFNPSDYLITADRTNENIVITDKVEINVPGTYLVTYQLGQIVKTLSVTVMKVVVVTPTPTPDPTESDPIEIVSLTSPVKAGANATIVIKGNPGETYYIEVIYKSGPSKASGLGSKVADSKGKVSWTWKVGINTSPGEWDIEISGEEETISTYFTVY
ncbi:MAG: bacterial Ig-like domain-containing protein [Erysipelotrichaceae bacterium]|nr:bacterial Ig-like domain-containing protein [Erysipelotrichaceae bacterium]